MNPCEQIPLTPYEQELRDEVIYLHSLWRQGPPPPPQNPPYRTHINNSLYHPPRTINLSVSNPTPFKRTKRNKPRKPISNYPYSGSDPGKEWPVESPPDPACSGSTSGWPTFKANNQSSPDKKVSSLELAEIATKQMQQRVVKVCNEFFGKRVGLDGGGGDEFDEEVEDEDYIDDDDCEVEESEEFKFLLSLFVENGELRKFYEDNLESGDFYCLVCGGVGEKVGKKFKGSKSVVQHAISISKTKRRRVHRVFAQVICRVLGWDFGRFPIIALKGETLSQSLANSGQNLSQSLANSGQTQHFLEEDDDKVTNDLGVKVPETGANKEATEGLGESKENAIHGKKDLNFPENNSGTVCGNDNESVPQEDVDAHQNVPTTCESSLNKDDINRRTIDPEENIGANNTETNLTEGDTV